MRHAKVGRAYSFRIKLLGECTTLDGKRYVNEAIGVVIERTTDKVRSSRGTRLIFEILPFLPDLARAIPTLCESTWMSS